MHTAKLNKVKEEIRRLSTAITTLESANSNSQTSTYMYGPKQLGAVRRASMDLTRALSDLRKPN